MILSKELITAVRATVRVLNDKYASARQQQANLEEAAIKAFLDSHPRIKRKMREREQVIKQLRKEEQRLEEFLGRFGLSYNFQRIMDAKKFHKHGGTVPIELKKPRHVEMTLAMLAGASEREGKLMLKQLGIKWE